jgi:acetate kinase
VKDAIVVLNAGSSSIKFSLFSLDGAVLDLVCRGQAEGIFTAPRFVAKDAAGNQIAEKIWSQGEHVGHTGALGHLVEFLKSHLHKYRPLAIGHRVVHGGLLYTSPVLANVEMLDQLEHLVPLAPLHQPHNLSPIRHLMAELPDLPQVACFDTAFHAAQPELAKMYALPAELTEGGVRRYGFHGLSYEYIASVLPDHDVRAAEGRSVVLHLGNGASMCAINAGRSIASTMGFSAAEGLPMGTRCGDMDPGVILYLIEQRGMSPAEVENVIYKQSGLLGLSGISSDMRVLQDSDDPKARLAIDYYIYRIGRELGSLSAALGGLDGVVFTAGIGENAVDLRQRVCEDAAWLGLQIDRSANEASGPRISPLDSEVSAWVIPTNEELMIARHTLQTISQA